MFFLIADKDGNKNIEHNCNSPKVKVKTTLDSYSYSICKSFTTCTVVTNNTASTSTSVSSTPVNSPTRTRCCRVWVNQGSIIPGFRESIHVHWRLSSHSATPKDWLGLYRAGMFLFVLLTLKNFINFLWKLREFFWFF